MDLNLMIQKHAEWKFKFHSAIATGEKLDSSTIARDNVCEFGKWLHASKDEFGSYPSFEKCFADHAAFHKEASKVAVAINAGKGDEAKQMMVNGSPYAEISRKIGVAIIELKNQLAIGKK